MDTGLLRALSSFGGEWLSRSTYLGSDCRVSYSTNFPVARSMLNSEDSEPTCVRDEGQGLTLLDIESKSSIFSLLLYFPRSNSRNKMTRFQDLRGPVPENTRLSFIRDLKAPPT